MNIPDVLQRYSQAIANNDKETWLNCFSDSPQLEHVDPVGGPARNSREAIGVFWDQLRGLFQEVRLDFDCCYGHQNEFVLHFTGRGTGVNGVPVVFPGIDVVRLDEASKIVSLRAFWDAAPVMAVLTQGLS